MVVEGKARLARCWVLSHGLVKTTSTTGYGVGVGVSWGRSSAREGVATNNASTPSVSKRTEMPQAHRLCVLASDVPGPPQGDALCSTRDCSAGVARAQIVLSREGERLFISSDALSLVNSGPSTSNPWKESVPSQCRIHT